MNLAGIIDYETLGKPRDGRPVLLNVAAVVFDLDSFELPSYQELKNNTFFAKFSISDQKSAGRVVNAETKTWWSNQDPALAKKTLAPSGEDVTLKRGHEDLLDFFRKSGLKQKASVIFCRGQSFDFPLLDVALMDSGLDGKEPCMFWNQMDTRSFLKGLFADPRGRKFPIPKGWIPDSEQKHDPIVDVTKDAGLIIFALMLAQGRAKFGGDKMYDMW